MYYFQVTIEYSSLRREFQRRCQSILPFKLIGDFYKQISLNQQEIKILNRTFSNPAADLGPMLDDSCSNV